MNIAPEPILKAGLMTLHWATVYARNWTLHPKVPVKMVNDLMEAIHEVPSILMHWSDEHSLDMLNVHLSRFNQERWKQQVDSETFNLPNLVAFFRDRLQEYTGDEVEKE
jgi:hypothetical protein